MRVKEEGGRFMGGDTCKQTETSSSSSSQVAESFSAYMSQNAPPSAMTDSSLPGEVSRKTSSKNKDPRVTVKMKMKMKSPPPPAPPPPPRELSEGAARPADKQTFWIMALFFFFCHGNVSLQRSDQSG
ncbi:Hypothetical predicted protein [Xyrichtys novacula]|uniref:Uncharacterized protein n=1 Tax=Xyrichtys novacula TaxID=13765 RepID=A0AAV1FDK5_XYRNO|nr:Hypothetical predicted protein [Xyrichtys novacula]